MYELQAAEADERRHQRAVHEQWRQMLEPSAPSRAQQAAQHAARQVASVPLNARAASMGRSASSPHISRARSPLGAEYEGGRRGNVYLSETRRRSSPHGRASRTGTPTGGSETEEDAVAAALRRVEASWARLGGTEPQQRAPPPVTWKPPGKFHARDARERGAKLV